MPKTRDPEGSAGAHFFSRSRSVGWSWAMPLGSSMRFRYMAISFSMQQMPIFTALCVASGIFQGV